MADYKIYKIANQDPADTELFLTVESYEKANYVREALNCYYKHEGFFFKIEGDDIGGGYRYGVRTDDVKFY